MSDTYTLERTARPGRRTRRCTSAELVDLAHRISSAADLQDARRTVVDRTAELLGTPWVAVTRYAAPKEMTFVANSGDIVRRVSQIATRTHEGPSWQLLWDGADLVLSRDLAAELRWPNFRRALLDELPVRSALALALRFGEEVAGALVLYSDEPDHFASGRLADAALTAEQVALSLAHVTARTKAANLEVALRTNREIAIAIGILMDRFRASEDEAFEVLRATSQVRHVKVRDLASQIVFTGEVPDRRDR